MSRALDIYIPCHRGDYFFTKICVASIRYYYPDVSIFLVKDEVNGAFSTKDLEEYFQVKIAELGRKQFGWTSSKVLLWTSKTIPRRKIFILDSDTVFVGRVLDQFAQILSRSDCDIIVSPEYKHRPDQPDFAKYYYDFGFFKKRYRNLSFPGFTFNTGTMVITPGIISEKMIRGYFHPARFPFWTKLAKEHLPLRDQSLLNLLVAGGWKEHRILFAKRRFMYWFRDPEVNNLNISTLQQGHCRFIIHWAGAKRSTFLPAMERGWILSFFQFQYFKRLQHGNLRFFKQFCLEGFRHVSRLRRGATMPLDTPQ